MAKDVLAKLTDKAGDVLDPDESFVGAQALTIKGPNALSAWAERVDVAEALPNHAARHDVTELRVGDLDVPSAFLAAVTDRRVLVFSRSITGRAKELVSQYDLADVSLDTVDMGERVKSRMFVFSPASGEIFAGECGINGAAAETADAFVTAYNEAFSAASRN